MLLLLSIIVFVDEEQYHLDLSVAGGKKCILIKSGRLPCCETKEKLQLG